MEEQENLKLIGIGTKESVALTPKTVKIVKANIETVGEGAKAYNKLVCEVKHPDKEDNIKISTLKFEQKSFIKTSGLWVKTDEEGKLQKGSATTILLEKLGCNNISELEGKECPTAEDDKGYLCLKAY